MCKIILIDEDENLKTCFCSGETPNQILQHYGIKTDTKNVYMNGKILTKEKMMNLVLDSGVIHIVVRNKVISR